jgi:hypothetical protein
VLEVTFADTHHSRKVCVCLRKSLAAPRLPILAMLSTVAMICRRVSLPDAEIEMILETASQRRHSRFPVDDLACRPALILTRPLGGYRAREFLCPGRTRRFSGYRRR